MMRASARICNRVEPVSEGTAEAMQDWDQPHWSGKPQPRPDTRPKLRPNLFARLVRACLRQPNVVTVIVATLTVLASAYAALTLTIDPNLAPRIGLDAQTLAAQARLDEKFPGIGKTLVARIANDDPATARATALAVATALAKRPDLFAQAFVPGTGIYYDKYGFLFKSLDDVNARVTQAMRMQPLFRALTAAPSMAGLSALVQQIGNVLAEGRSPSGLASVLAAASATVESELAGHSQRLSWVEIAGLTADSESKLWFVIVTPAPGVERSAASYAVTATASLPGLSWYLPAGLRSGGGSPVRDLVVPAIVALLAVLTVLLIGLGDVRYLLPVAMTAGVALTLSLGAAAAIDPVLDAASWSILAVATGPAFLFASVVVLAHVEARRRGSDTDVAIMLAAQRRGLLVVMLALVWAIFWVTWLPRSLPSLAELAMMALASIVISAGLAFTLVPVLLQAFDRRPAPQPHWLDEAVAAPPGPNARNALQVLVLVLVAASAFCGVFVPALRFGDVAALSRQAAPLDTPAAIDAVHLLTPPGAPALALARSLAALPETGSIRWIEQFLPEDTGRKLALLRQLDGFLPGGPAASDVPDAPALDRTFADLATGLRQISDSPAASPELRDAAQRLRRAVALYAGPVTPDANRTAGLEDALFSGLGDLAAAADRLARLDDPRPADLDRDLQRRFVAADGTWRMEAVPAAGVSRLSFAAAIRRLDPAAAGDPIAELARNEIMHHEAGLAAAFAGAAAVLLLLAYLRRIFDWLLALLPAAATAALSAALVVGSGGLLDSASLAAVMAALAMALSVTLILLIGIREEEGRAGRSPGTAFRSALLPPLAMIAAMAPLAISSDAQIGNYGLLASLFVAIAVLTSLILVPQLSSWLASLRRSGE
ncbi:MAG: hypothetical protein HYX36_13075 [Rhizobiales bacterium]|nr:hypothetical protein [Hyphomicrobiales bacterium]